MTLAKKIVKNKSYENPTTANYSVKNDTKKESPSVIAVGPSWLLLLKPSTWHCNRLPKDDLPYDLSRADFNSLNAQSKDTCKNKLYKKILGQIEAETVQGMHEFAKNIYAYFLVSGGSFPDYIHTYSSGPSWIEPFGDKSIDEMVDDTQNDHNKTNRNNYICAMVHRLDLETSGVLLFATNISSQMVLRAAFRNRLMEKSYAVLVHGIPPDMGVIDLPLLTLSDGCSQRRYRGDGKTHGSHFTRCAEIGEEGSMEARSEWEVLRVYKLRSADQILRLDGVHQTRIDKILKERDSRIVEDLKSRNIKTLKDAEKNNSPWSNHVSLLKVRIVTGRTHQIRVHMGYMGNPVVGDIKYLPSSVAYTDRLWCPRQWLHSSELTFIDPDRIDKKLLYSLSEEQDPGTKQFKKLKARVPLCNDISSALHKGCVLVEERRPLGAEISLPSPYTTNSSHPIVKK